MFDCDMNSVEQWSRCCVCSCGAGQELLGRTSREVALAQNKKGFPPRRDFLFFFNVFSLFFYVELANL